MVGGGPAGPAGVDHSYGGAVITDAAAQADNAVGLVHAAGFALDVGESAEEITGRLPRTPSAGSLRPPTYRTDTGTWAVEVALDPGSFVHTYAQDLPSAAGALMGVAQRPAAMACLTEPARSPTRRLPSWYLVAADERCLHPDAQWFMARRAHFHTFQTAGSHAVTVTQPTAVADIVLTAARVLQVR